ncbi:MAG: geranylgeranylglycerol-phosphate geranylgeranyltransferase, partial [Bacteroidales bacterium]|nr:geranylgeranylglycerol-phosphate geranylgeranyltransferase [Bacteroidales bacterium]
LHDDPLVVTRMTFQLGWIDFVVLVVSTVLITAAGYVINDYFDIRTDLINRGRIIVGNTITRRKAMLYHNILNFIGVAGGFYVSARIGYLWLGIFFLLVSGLLYFYSASYKRQFLIGNLIVAFLTAMVPLMVVLYDAPAIYARYSSAVVSFPGVGILFYWVGGFALFAFLTTLIREIIKDMEDYEGDLALERKTLPLSAGMVTSRIVVVVLSLLTLLALYIIWFRYLNDKITLLLITLLIALPFVFVIYYVLAGREKHSLHVASRMMKIIMLFGIFYSLVAGALITSGKIL